MIADVIFEFIAKFIENRVRGKFRYLWFILISIAALVLLFLIFRQLF